MLLLDDILYIDVERVKARVRVNEQSVCFTPGFGVPIWIGLEYMAQAVGMIAGMQAKTGDWELTNGYLLGTRRFRCTTSWLAEGASIIVEGCQELMIDAGIGAFVCSLSDERDTAQTLAECRLTIYRNPPHTDNGGEDGNALISS